MPTKWDRLRPALAALQSFHDGDRGVAEVVAFGAEAIPFLRALLFEREPSGLFEARRRVVEALAMLGATKVLIEFLEDCPEVTDPVERLGQDAVINTAAYALRGSTEPGVFELLLSLARKRIRSGLVATLGAFHRPEAIPIFIDALAEDESRFDVEVALRGVAPFAREALIAAASRRTEHPERESESRLRQRRNALAILVQIGIRSGDWPRLRAIMEDPDPRLSAFACQLCLTCAAKTERRDAVVRLRRLLSLADIPLRLEIEQSLARIAREDEER